MKGIARCNIVSMSHPQGAYVISVADHLADKRATRQAALQDAARVADMVGAKARTDDGKETADKIARRIRALMEGAR